MTGHVGLVRASDVGGLPVVTIDEGEDAAEIRDVVYDASRHHLVGFTLNKRGWFRGTMSDVLAADAIEGIGADAVMVASADALTSSDRDAGALTSPGDSYDVIGVGVMTSGGVALGNVVDVIIETGVDPVAVGYEVSLDDSTVFVPTSAQMALSGEHLVVPAEADDFVTNDLAGFGASVASFRALISQEGTNS